MWLYCLVLVGLGYFCQMYRFRSSKRFHLLCTEKIENEAKPSGAQRMKQLQQNLDTCDQTNWLSDYVGYIGFQVRQPSTPMCMGLYGSGCTVPPSFLLVCGGPCSVWWGVAGPGPGSYYTHNITQWFQTDIAPLAYRQNMGIKSSMHVALLKQHIGSTNLSQLRQASCQTCEYQTWNYQDTFRTTPSTMSCIVTNITVYYRVFICFNPYTNSNHQTCDRVT